MSAICSEISSVAFAVWLASDLTSDSTTAKPLPASPARARGLDGRIERQEVGLRGNGVDQADHFANPAGRFCQSLDRAVGVSRLADRTAGDPGGVRGLLADIVDRRAQFLRRSGDGLDAP